VSAEALRLGTMRPMLYSPYAPLNRKRGGGVNPVPDAEYYRDLQALEQFNRTMQERWRLACEYESRYGPLLQFGRSYLRYPWQWAESPWPWEV